MKIRILNNTIRYRLTRSEVTTLGETGMIEAQTSFTGNSLHYAIEQYSEQQLRVTFKANRITLYMPKQMIDELQNSSQVGFEDTTGPVSILIEKDFVCLDNRAEDQSDNYPNPNMVC